MPGASDNASAMMTGSPTPVGPGTRQGSQIAAVVDSSILHQLSACGPSCSNSSTAPSACPTFGSDFWIDNPGGCQVSQSFWDVDLITLLWQAILNMLQCCNTQVRHMACNQGLLQLVVLPSSLRVMESTCTGAQMTSIIVAWVTTPVQPHLFA